MCYEVASRNRKKNDSCKIDANRDFFVLSAIFWYQEYGKNDAPAKKVGRDNFLRVKLAISAFFSGLLRLSQLAKGKKIGRRILIGDKKTKNLGPSGPNLAP